MRKDATVSRLWLGSDCTVYIHGGRSPTPLECVASMVRLVLRRRAAGGTDLSTTRSMPTAVLETTTRPSMRR